MKSFENEIFEQPQALENSGLDRSSSFIVTIAAGLKFRI